MSLVHLLPFCFVEIIPRSSAAYSTTLASHNLRYITVSKQDLSNDVPVPTNRTIKLSLAIMLGRQCFSFGSARSNDYQLPSDEGIAPHHFIIYLGSQDRGVYLRNTSNKQLIISTHALYQTDEIPSDVGIRIDTTVNVQIGHKNGPMFQIKVSPLSHHGNLEACIALYFASLQQRKGVSSVSAYQRKRRRSIGTEDDRRTKRHRAGDFPATLTQKNQISLFRLVRYFFRSLW
jgi:hypothetical protein